MMRLLILVLLIGCSKQGAIVTQVSIDPEAWTCESKGFKVMFVGTYTREEIERVCEERE